MEGAAVAKALVMLAVVAAAAVVVDGAICPYTVKCRCAGGGVKCDGATAHMDALPTRNAAAGNWAWINMARNNISSVPDDTLPLGMGTLESWFTPLTDWGPQALDGSKYSLLKFIVQHHTMTKVPECLTRLSSQFHYLDLTWGNISDISALANITEGLKWMKFDGNAIDDAKAVEEAMAPHVSTLIFIGLAYNKLTAAPNVTVQSALTAIRLDNNMIADVPEGYLGDQLTSFEARNNLLTEIPKDLFRQHKLYALRLSGNRIKSVDNFDFGAKLTNLDLDNNLIEELHSFNFPGGTHLKWVQMFNNPLKYIAPDAFNHAKQIRQLTLSNTKLTRLPLAVTVLPRLAMLYFNGVNLTCTCEESAVGAWKLRHPSMNIGGECQGNVSVTRFLHELMPQCSVLAGTQPTLGRD